jgi:hypothetical protein
MNLADGGTIAWIVGALVALAVAGGAVAFALWQSEE